SADSTSPTSASSDAAKLLRPPLGNSDGPAVLVGTTWAVTNISIEPAIQEPGGSIAVSLQGTPVVDLSEHYMLDARLTDGNGAIISEAMVPDSQMEQPPTTKWGIPIRYVMHLAVPTNLSRGLYHVSLAAFRIPTWQALPLSRTDGASAASLEVGNV